MIRRSFLEGILGACIAPAFVRPTSLMPLWLPATEIEVPSFDADWVTWSEPLVQYESIVGEFIEMLRPVTIISHMKLNRDAPFNLRIGARHG